MILCSRQSPPGLSERLATLRSPVFLRSLAISGGLFFLCQYTGISTLVVFMAPVFKDSGLTLDPRLAPVIIGAVRVFTSCCSSAALKKANRRYMFTSCSLLTSRIYQRANWPHSTTLFSAVLYVRTVLS